MPSRRPWIVFCFIILFCDSNFSVSIYNLVDFQVLPDDQLLLELTSKEISGAGHEYMNIHPDYYKRH